ncbi:MAG: hypothetical protein NVSMB45_18910 [Ginsengibacter sp.]
MGAAKIMAYESYDGHYFQCVRLVCTTFANNHVSNSGNSMAALEFKIAKVYSIKIASGRFYTISDFNIL